MRRSGPRAAATDSNSLSDSSAFPEATNAEAAPTRAASDEGSSESTRRLASSCSSNWPNCSKHWPRYKSTCRVRSSDPATSGRTRLSFCLASCQRCCDTSTRASSNPTEELAAPTASLSFPMVSSTSSILVCCRSTSASSSSNAARLGIFWTASWSTSMARAGCCSCMASTAVPRTIRSSSGKSFIPCLISLPA